MAATTTPEAVRGHDRSRLRPFLFVDVGAPALVVIYLLLRYAPFADVVDPPGAASSVLFPAMAVGLLAVTPTARLLRIPIIWPMWAFVIWMMVSRLWSESPSSTEFEIRAELLPLILVGLVAGTIEPKVLVRTLTAAFVAISTWSLLISLALPRAREVVYEAGLDDPQLGFRGTFGHKNQMGMFAVLGLVLVLAFVNRRSRRFWIAVLVTATLTTRSATAGSGLFAVIWIWLWLTLIGSRRSPRERALVVLLSVSAAVTGVLLALRILPTLLGVYQKDVTFSGRTYIWAESMRLVSEQPWTGYGYGGLFSGTPPPLTGELRRRIGFDAAHAHNGAVALLVDVGIIGLGLFALVLLSAIAMSVRAMLRPATAPYGRWVLVSVLALVLMSLSEPVFEGPDLGFLMVALVALARVVNDDRHPQRRVSSSQTFAWRTQSVGT